MEDLPVFIQSGDEKYPDMVKVISVASHCLLEEPQSGVIEKQNFQVQPRIAVCLQQDQDKPAACIGGSELKRGNNCEF